MDSSKISTARCFDVYLVLAAHLQGATAAELCRATGMAAIQIDEHLETLSAMGLVEADPQYAWRYRLGARSMQLGSAGRYVEMRTLAWPYLQQLQVNSRHKVSLHILDGYLQRSIDICPRLSQAELRRLPEAGYRNGRILRFGATALAILAFMPDEELSRILASFADPPSREQIDQEPQFAHLKQVTVDRKFWDAHSPTSDSLREVRTRGYACSRSGIGQAMTVPIFERGSRVCGGVCIFGEETDEEISAGQAQRLLAAGALISADLGYRGEYPGSSTRLHR